MPEVLFHFLKGLSDEDAMKVWNYVADGDDPQEIQKEIILVLEGFGRGSLARQDVRG